MTLLRFVTKSIMLAIPLTFFSCKTSTSEKIGSELAAKSPDKMPFNQSNLKTGQIIGISESTFDPTTFFFELATKTRFGHIGFISVEGSNVYVYHMTPEAGAIKGDLKGFLQRADMENPMKAKNIAVVQLNTPITATEAKKLVSGADSLVKKNLPYNFSQSYTPASSLASVKALNCSEFVHEVFKSVGRDLGQSETFNQLNTNALNGNLKKLWIVNYNPAAEQSKYMSPASIMLDTDVTKVMGNLPVSKVKEIEILDAWKADGGLTSVGQILNMADSSYPAEANQLYSMLKSQMKN